MVELFRGNNCKYPFKKFLGPVKHSLNRTLHRSHDFGGIVKAHNEECFLKIAGERGNERILKILKTSNAKVVAFSICTPV